MRLVFRKNLKVEKGIDFAPEHIARLIKAGKLPKPIRINNGQEAFIEAELDALLEKLAADRDVPPGSTDTATAGSVSTTTKKGGPV